MSRLSSDLFASVLGHLLVAIRLLRCLRTGLSFKLGNHVLDQALHLGEDVIAVGRAVLHRGTNARGELRQHGGMGRLLRVLLGADGLH
eukprot:7020692-Heterocapsa_arctica.AAC.1